jgi:hypothetical protein
LSVFGLAIKINGYLNESEKQNMANELTAVKKRLEVLDAIVTVKKYQLAQEISELKSVK